MKAIGFMLLGMIIYELFLAAPLGYFVGELINKKGK